MNCPQFQKIWPHREVLSLQEQHQLYRHLETCLECQIEEQRWQQVLDNWKPAEPPAVSPQIFLCRLHERLADEPRHPRRNLVYAASVGLLLLTLVSAGWWIVGHSDNAPEAEMATEVPSSQPLPSAAVKLLRETRQDMASQALKILDQSITTLRGVEGGDTWDDEVL